MSKETDTDLQTSDIPEINKIRRKIIDVSWVTPLLASVALPAHAQTTDISTTATVCNNACTQETLPAGDIRCLYVEHVGCSFALQNSPSTTVSSIPFQYNGTTWNINLFVSGLTLLGGTLIGTTPGTTYPINAYSNSIEQIVTITYTVGSLGELEVCVTSNGFV